MSKFLHRFISLFKSQKRVGYPDVTERIRGGNDAYSPKRIAFENDFSDVFDMNLRKTIGWTETIISGIEDYSKINYSKVLRTTNPLYQGIRPFYIFDDTPYNYASTPSIGFDYNAILHDALMLRSEVSLLQKDINALGKILIFEIDLTTHDGAPCAETNGFVDESDIPPIDTWFFVTKKYLYCWIPSLFIDKMWDAINVEIFDSYTWLEGVNPALNRNIISKVEMVFTG